MLLAVKPKNNGKNYGKKAEKIQTVKAMITMLILMPLLLKLNQATISLVAMSGIVIPNLMMILMTIQVILIGYLKN